MPVRLLDDMFGRFDNGARSDAIVVDELVRLPAVRNDAHREFMDFDAFGTHGVEHGIAHPAVCIMIFNRQELSL